MNELHVGLPVHHVSILPADEEHDTQIICEAALITTIRDREKRVVSLYVFPEGSELVDTRNIRHDPGLVDGTWHFIDECQNGS